MRLHRIAVQAFGPFAERVEVDVDALAVHGLFLLHGPTGAGKTSLLDAVCFALYGVVPGARSSLRQTTLRSDHAAPGVAPVVEVELTVGRRRFEVRRSPAWQRPKARGAGTTTEQASVRVRELVGGRWEPLASRLDEAGHLLSSLLGMDAQQFTTVVLLPQGDFATFLRAGPDDRRAVLERLFGTDRFAAVETWLALRRTESGRALREAQGERDQLLARVDERAAPLRELAPEPVETTTPDAVGASRLYEVAAARLETTRLELTEHQRALLASRHEVEHQADAERRDRERYELLVRHEALAGRAEPVTALRHALARDAAAAAVAPLAERCELAAAELEQVTTDLDEALSRLPRARRSRDPRVLAERADTLGGEVAVLAALLAQEAELARGRTALAAAQAELVALEHELGSVRAEQAALDRAGAELAEARARAERATGRLAVDRDALRRARAVQAAVTVCTRVAPQVRRADDRTRAADDALAAARADHLDLVDRRLAGMAAELASALAAGTPCPVCGADEHPAPAVGTDTVDAALVARALRTATGLAARAATEREQRDGLLAELAAAEVVAGGRTAEEAAEAVRTAEAVVADGEAATTALHRLDERRAAAAAQRTRCEARGTEVEQRRAHVHDTRTGLLSRVEDLAVRLDRARGGDATVVERHARLTADLSALAAAAAAAREVPGARRALTGARRQADRAAAAAGFATLGDALAAVLVPAERSRSGAAVAAYDRELAGVEERLAHPDLAPDDPADDLADDLADDPADDPAPSLAQAEGRLLRRAARAASARAAAEAAEAQVRRTTAGATVLESTAVALHALATELERHEDAAAAVEQDAAVLEELAGCALGTSASNTLRMRLSAYVLAARLEQVAAAASVRLRATSGGRYELRHSDARGRGGGRSGLGLVVVDHWTGQERATASLSGGETFLASLALALGLADVVQAESGGLAIETLFVDEGFGSLDDDTLEQVMAGLDALREGGRAIGLVSHLPELRSRIPSQLHVVRGERGSTVRSGRRAG